MAGNTRRVWQCLLTFFRVMQIHIFKVIWTLIAQCFLLAVIIFLLFVITFMRSLRARRSCVFCGRYLINLLYWCYLHLSPALFLVSFLTSPSLHPSGICDDCTRLSSLYASRFSLLILKFSLDCPWSWVYRVFVSLSGALGGWGGGDGTYLTLYISLGANKYMSGSLGD